MRGRPSFQCARPRSAQVRHFRLNSRFRKLTVVTSLFRSSQALHREPATLSRSVPVLSTGAGGGDPFHLMPEGRAGLDLARRGGRRQLQCRALKASILGRFYAILTLVRGECGRWRRRSCRPSSGGASAAVAAADHARAVGSRREQRRRLFLHRFARRVCP